jgi:hypothetical protein
MAPAQDGRRAERRNLREGPSPTKGSAQAIWIASARVSGFRGLAVKPVRISCRTQTRLMQGAATIASLHFRTVGVDGWCSPRGHGREALPGVDAFGCLRSLRAHSALDAVSCGQRGWVEIAAAAVGQCNSVRAIAHAPPRISRSCRRSPPRGTDCHQRAERRRGPRHTSMLGADRHAIAASVLNQKFPANVKVYSPALVEASEAIASAVRRTSRPI